MTTGLTQQAHRLVELARGGDEPTAAQLLSLHGAIAASIAAEAALAATAANAATTAATGKVASAGALMKGLVAAGAIATGAAGFIALQPEPAPQVAPARVAPQVKPAPVARAAPSEPAPAAPPEVVPAPTAPSRPAKSSSALRLQDEAALLAEVQGALRSGQAQRALAKLESYDKRFPAGMLRAEADAARVFALCAAGHVDKARAAASRFVQRYPSAPVTARVQAACK